MVPRLPSLLASCSAGVGDVLVAFHGYYRAATAELRVALELAVICQSRSGRVIAGGDDRDVPSQASTARLSQELRESGREHRDKALLAVRTLT
jgi:hypothetical protein